MNDKVKDILANAKVTVAKNKETIAKENDRKLDYAEMLALKASINGKYYLQEIFKEIIDDYKFEPSAFGNNEHIKDNNCVRNYFYVELPKPTQDIGSSADRIAKFYNDTKYNDSGIYFKIIENGKRLPLRFDVDRINQYKIFDEFRRKIADGNQICFYSEIGVLTLYKLTKEAYDGTLVKDHYLFTDEIITLLKKTYIEVTNMTKHYQHFIDEAIQNTNVIYIDIYNQIANKYIQKPGEKQYEAFIDKVSRPTDSSQIEAIAFYNESALVNKRGDLVYLVHQENKNVKENISIYMPALLDKFKNEQDTKAGYIGLGNCDYDGYTFKFDGEKLEKYMKELENEKAKKRIKQKEAPKDR